MASGLNSATDIAAAYPEIHFALVLARTIEAVSSDAELLRSAVYDLARQKLQELAQDQGEKQRLLYALEIAIASVEAHSKDAQLEKALPSFAGYLEELNDRDATVRRIESPISLADAGERRNELTAFVPSTYTAAWSSKLTSQWPSPIYSQASIGQEPRSTIVEHTMLPVGETRATKGMQGTPTNSYVAWSSKPKASRWLSSMALRYAAMLAFFGMVAAVLWAQTHGFSPAEVRSGDFANWFGTYHASTKPAAELTLRLAPAAVEPAPVEAKPRRALPATYGVFAESAGKLYELEALQGRAPDLRVAISAAITKPSETVVPDGHLRFIVYRRDAKSDASDAVDVRVIAKVRQATMFDPAGKPVTAPSDNVWVIRNISLPYRATPIKEDQQMYGVEARDTNEALSPGRYALILRGVAYDFTVEGTPNDKRHCLERLVAANGVFYSECPMRDGGHPAMTSAPTSLR